jgi:hypothetical protein
MSLANMIRSKLVSVVLLLVFASSVLFLDFFHVEKVVDVKEACPVCQFQSSIPNISQFDLVGACCTPDLRLLEILATTDSTSYCRILIANPSSRSPPAA